MSRASVRNLAYNRQRATSKPCSARIIAVCEVILDEPRYVSVFCLTGTPCRLRVKRLELLRKLGHLDLQSALHICFPTFTPPCLAHCAVVLLCPDDYINKNVFVASPNPVTSKLPRSGEGVNGLHLPELYNIRSSGSINRAIIETACALITVYRAPGKSQLETVFARGLGTPNEISNWKALHRVWSMRPMFAFGLGNAT